MRKPATAEIMRKPPQSEGSTDPLLPRREQIVVQWPPMPQRVRYAIRSAAEANFVRPLDLLGGSKFLPVVAARAHAIRSLLKSGHSQSQIGRWLNLHPSTVNYYAQNKNRVREPESDAIPCPDLSGEWAI